MTLLHAHSHGDEAVGFFEFFDEVVIHGLLDTIKLIPFLFLTYLLMEFIEHNASDKTRAIMTRAGKLGPLVGAWLGFVFGLIVIATGGAALFFAFSVPGTVITVLLKGAACGFVAGLVYKLLESKLKYVAAIIASLLCPIVNTGIFLLGSAVFFMPYAEAIGELVGVDKAGFGVFVALAFGNFIIEVLMNGLLSPVFVRIIKIVKIGSK